MSAHGKIKAELLALALAEGSTVKKWCTDNDVPIRTGYYWASKPAFKARVARHLGERVKQTMARLTQGGPTAAAALWVIAGNSASKDSDRIAAARAIIASMIDVATFAELNDRVAALEEASAVKGKGKR